MTNCQKGQIFVNCDFSWFVNANDDKLGPFIDQNMFEKVLSTVKQEIFVSEKFRQTRPSGSSSDFYLIYNSQTSIVARLLFDRSVIALLLIVYIRIHEYV